MNEVVMQAPPHGPAVGLVMVGVQEEPVGHEFGYPLTVHGISGGNDWVVRQRPPQTCVWLQMEPAGQASPPMMQGSS